MANTVILENLKDTIKQAERYTLLGLASSVVFAALSLPNPEFGDVGMVKWSLLGVPLPVSPQLALIVLYLVYVSACLLADNMIIHVRDLSDKFEEKEQVRAILSYPTILTVSPIGRLFGTILPTGLVVIALIKIHVQGVYQLPLASWGFAYLFSFQGVLVYVRVRMYILPNLYPEKKRVR